MVSPFTAYFAGIGTVVAALVLGFAGGYILTSPSPSQKEQASAFQKKIEVKPEKPAEPAGTNVAAAVSPNVTAAFAPNVSTAFSPPVAPAAWPSATIQSTAQDPPKLAPDPGALQPPVRPAAPVEAAVPVPAQPVAKSRDSEPAIAAGRASGGWKKKEKKEAFAQRKAQRRQIERTKPAPVDAGEAEEVVETRSSTTYAPERRHPLGIFNLLGN